jgi:hypothetical protein
MNTAKSHIVLTDDNWADYLPTDYPESLIAGLTIGECGIDRDGPAVTRLLAWLARESGQSPDVRYGMSRHDAAVLLELLAGWPGRLIGWVWPTPPAPGTPAGRSSGC